MAKQYSAEPALGLSQVVHSSDAINANADGRLPRKAGAAVTGVGVCVCRLRLPGIGRVAEM
jgi:hypothetical protein